MINCDDFIGTYVRELLIITAMHDEMLDHVKMGRPIPGTFKFQHVIKQTGRANASVRVLGVLESDNVRQSAS